MVSSPEASNLLLDVFDPVCVIWKCDGSLEDPGKGSYTDIAGTRYVHRVSSLAAAPFAPFDAENMSRMCAGKGKYVGMTAREVRDAWALTGLSARTMGTEMHSIIEDFMGGAHSLTQCADRASAAGLSKEWTQFGKWLADTQTKRGLRTFQQEWRVGDPGSRVAGTVDYISEAGPNYRRGDGGTDVATPKGRIVIYDWKRSKLISKAKNEASAMCGLTHLRDNNFTKYSLQLNIYAELIERNYNLTVVGLYIVQFHETRKAYKEFAAADLRSEARILIDSGGKGLRDKNVLDYLSGRGLELVDA